MRPRAPVEAVAGAATPTSVARGLVLSVWFVLVSSALGAFAGEEPGTRQGDGSSGCMRCHERIEAMHPQAELSCVDCHGGDDTAVDKLAAHAHRPRRSTEDERVAPLDEDLAWRRFRNPMDLRVAERNCGSCHGDLVRHLTFSLHGTTAGHLSDGYYEVGLLEERGSPFGVFPVYAHVADAAGEIESLRQVPAFDTHAPKDELSTHFTDLVRKECMQCHLWSEGRAVRGRVGFDGDYRGEGCAACHVPYALHGMSESADRKIPRNEPGHPLRHEMVRTPTTAACTSCHYGDASIGLHFRGLSQLPPGAPGGPEIPGTTSSPLNRQFYLQDPSVTPPDVHHEKGMHCVDCHTLSDVMGDGQLHGNMEHAVEISCSACHGTFERASDLVTERGAPIENLFRRGEQVFLRSKVTGAEHPVKQVVHVLDPARPEYNPEAARAMTKKHAGVECYTCHAGWNVNFLGFHFDRNETLTQLDLLSGGKTPGRVTTQEKVFATWKSFYAGRNETGAIAPYLTGFSMMGSVTDADGERILDQVMPVTSNGLSGMTMIHHQLHSTRPTARSCVECHRSSATWGMGSINFRLARQLAFVADRRGVEVVALSRGNLPGSVPLAKVVLPDVIDLEIHADPLQGYAQYVYASEGGRGIHVLDVRDPTRPRRVAFIDSVSPRGMQLVDDHLYSADGIGGLRIYDVSEPAKIHLVAQLPMFDAHDVYVQWPYAYVADGPAGLAIVDVRAPIAPRLVTGIATGRDPTKESDALGASVLFQYSRPTATDEGAPSNERTEARNLCVVLDERAGPVLVDVTEPSRPVRLFPDLERRSSSRQNLSYRGLVVKSHVDLASPQGGTRTYERDYAYMLVERLFDNGLSASNVVVMDITNPYEPRNVGSVGTGQSTEMLAGASFYNQPFLQNVVLAPGQQGVIATDVSISAEPRSLGPLQAVTDAYVVAVEEYPLDAMIGADGRRLKDVSHEGSRWLYRSEVERILAVPGEVLGTVEAGSPPRPTFPGATARLHFKGFDRDRSGFLEGGEYVSGGGEAADVNDDGRVSLRELAEYGSVPGFEVPTAVAQAELVDDPFGLARVGRDGDLARLLDGVNPYAFDTDDDDRLDSTELRSAFFAALDLDGDGGLSYAELSRYPGELRQLRYRDEWGSRLFDEMDLNNNGRIGAREFRVRDREWSALDRDADGFVQLAVSVSRWERERGMLPRMSEWPARRALVTGLPPVISVERLFEVFDRDGDGKLSARELRRRPDLLEELDADDDSALGPEELQGIVAAIQAGGVDATLDGFLERWDLDRDGTVRRAELPANAPIPSRVPIARK